MEKPETKKNAPAGPPKISILVAAYNAAPFLPACLDSLLAQTEGSFQAICIDDASTDSTPQVLRDYAARDPRFEVVSLPRNVGLARARNQGLERVRGELAMTLDADDSLSADALEKVWQAYRARPQADGVMLRLVLTYPDGRQELWKGEEMPPVLTGQEAFLRSIDWRIHGLFALRAELFRQMPFDTTCRLYTDDNTVRLHYLHCREVVACGGTYFYRQHAASATHQFGMGRLDFIEANRGLRRQVEASGAGEEALRRCERHCWLNFIGMERDLRRHAGELSPQERKTARAVMVRALGEMRPERLDWRLRLRPSAFFVSDYALFSRIQRLWAAIRRPWSRQAGAK